MKTLDHLKPSSPASFVPGSTKHSSILFFPSHTDSISSKSFANFQLIPGKMIEDQISVKMLLEMVNNKLNKSTEHLRTLEEHLQNALDDNVKLRLKQKEDDKLWKALEFKFSSTKMLFDQLNATLHLFTGQIQDAEKDQEYFEAKLSSSLNAINDVNQKLNCLSVKLGSAEQTIRNRERKLAQLKVEKEDKDKLFMEEQQKTANLLEEKDAMLEELDATGAAKSLEIVKLQSQLNEVCQDLGIKEDKIKGLMNMQEKLDLENRDLLLDNSKFASKLSTSHRKMQNLECFVHLLTVKLGVLDKQSLAFVEKTNQLNHLYDRFFELIQQRGDNASTLAKSKYDELHDKFLCMTSEKDALQLVNKDLNNKIVQLQKSEESALAQLSEECHSASERIRILESETENLLSKNKEKEVLVSKLEEKIEVLFESIKMSENKMQDMSLKISALKMENKDNTMKLQADVQKKAEELYGSQRERETCEQRIDLLEKQVNQLNSVLDDKEQLILHYRDMEKKLDGQITKNQLLLNATECELSESKKQYDMMIESKQFELSRHLKEISHRNDQEIRDIRKKYEVEKLEIASMEKQKADKVMLEIKCKWEQKLAENKEESRQLLVRIQEEHAALVLGIEQDHDRKETCFRNEHDQELKSVKSQTERELREKIMHLRNEHEIQMAALRCQNEDECRKLQDELELQKSKEDRQRALLQLQWKVMSDGPPDNHEVNSKKTCCVSLIKIKDSGGCQKNQLDLEKRDVEEQRLSCMPVSKLLKTVEVANSKNAMSIPKHRRKVTRREYEVKTANGRTITKRRKTKSTIMFEEPRNLKNSTSKSLTPRVTRGIRRVTTRSSNIGDLFSEGSLNPYADDPYKFD